MNTPSKGSEATEIDWSNHPRSDLALKIANEMHKELTYWWGAPQYMKDLDNYLAVRIQSAIDKATEMFQLEITERDRVIIGLKEQLHLESRAAQTQVFNWKSLETVLKLCLYEHNEGNDGLGNAIRAEIEAIAIYKATLK
jgi:hypothetical protein